MLLKNLLQVITALCFLATSGVADQTAVTIYNSDLGVVSETRTLSFDKGIGQLQFTDVPWAIDPASVRFEALGTGKNVNILEQNYVYDLVSPQQMYQKYIDKKIELIDKEGQLYTGILLAHSNGAVTLMDDNGKVKIVTLANIAETNFPTLPEGLITRPTLFWLYSSDYSGSLDCNVGYQTTGMNWSAEYVGVLDANETNLDLSGWSSITNNSGKTYKDAKLKLIAGDIHQATPERHKGRQVVKMATMADGMGFQEKAFFEYHMYTLPRKATLANKEVKQISLFEPAQTEITKIYLYRPDFDPNSVDVNLEFFNSQKAGLGMPLPAGRVRLFKADDDGSMVLLGEDRIKHTPKDEKIIVTVGKAFDIVPEEKVLSSNRISKKVEDRNYEIKIRNHKKDDINVRVDKKLWGTWEITSSSHKFEQKDVNSITLSVPVTANSETIVTFTVRNTTR